MHEDPPRPRGSEPRPRWTHTSTPPPQYPPPVIPLEEEPRGLWDTVGHIRPWGAGFLLITWIILFGVMMFRGEVGDSPALSRWGANLVRPGEIVGGWRLLASTFLHAGLAHVFFNGVAMAIFGPAVERIFGHARFWILFAAGGLISAWASAGWRASQIEIGQSISVGASGAIFALGGAMLAASWKLRRRLPPGRARALAGSLLPLVLQGLVSGMTRSGTDNIAHISGLVSGLVLGAIIGMDPRLSRSEPPGWLPVVGAIAAGALLFSLLQSVLHGLALIQ